MVVDAFTIQLIQWLNVAEASYVVQPLLTLILLIEVLVLIKKASRIIFLLEALLHAKYKRIREPIEV